MRDNGRPVMLASDFYPHQIDLKEGCRPLIACPDCDAWTPVKRHMLLTHRLTDNLPKRSYNPARRQGEAPRRASYRLPKCPGTGQRIWIDITIDQWRDSLTEAVREAARRRPTRIYPPEPRGL